MAFTWLSASFQIFHERFLRSLRLHPRARERSYDNENQAGPKWPNIMRTRHHLATLVATLTAAASMHAESWDLLLPDTAHVQAGSGETVLSDPSAVPDPGLRGLFLGHSPTEDGTTISYLAPSDPAWAAYSMVSLDGGIQSVTKIGYNQVDATLYAVGANNSVWTVRKSQPGNFSSLFSDETFALAKGKPSRATGFTVDTEGNAYVCGWSVFGQRHWVVRRKLAGRANWATVSDIKAKGDCVPRSLCFALSGGTNPANAVFAVGDVADQWTVMRSRDNGGSWQNVDASWSKTHPNVIANDIASDSAGNLYVVGYHQNISEPAFLTGCVVRISQDGGDHWTTLLDVQGGPGVLGLWKLAIEPGPTPTVTLNGEIHAGSGASWRWAVIRCTNPQDAASWQTSYVNPFFPLEGIVSRGHAIACDPEGRMVLAGAIFNQTGTNPVVGLLRLVLP